MYPGKIYIRACAFWSFCSGGMFEYTSIHCIFNYTGYWNEYNIL